MKSLGLAVFALGLVVMLSFVFWGFANCLAEVIR